MTDKSKMTDEELLAQFDVARWLRFGHRRTTPISDIERMVQYLNDAYFARHGDKPDQAVDAWIDSGAARADLRIIGIELRPGAAGLVGVCLPHFQDADARDDAAIGQLREACIADAPGIRMGIIKFLQRCGLVELKEVRAGYVCLEVTEHPATQWLIELAPAQWSDIQMDKVQ